MVQVMSPLLAGARLSVPGKSEGSENAKRCIEGNGVAPLDDEPDGV
jgi:hypothetical protein